MLPPLNLADSKGGFFSQKRVDGGESIGSSSTRKRSSVQIVRPSPRASRHNLVSRNSENGGESGVASPRAGESLDEPSPQQPRPDRDGNVNLADISMIPREFFVVETNAVLLPQNYPPNQYKSTLNAQAQWETVVFPALTPHNRQQVLYLRQTLDKMRAAIPQFVDKCEGAGPETETDASVLAERRRLVIEYTRQETKIYSYCYHELARQIKCICKEQSELLHEIRERYDAAVARLIDQVKTLDVQNNQQQDQLAELAAKYDRAVDANKQLAQRVEELESQVKFGPTVAVALEAYKLRRPQRKRLGSDKVIDEDDEGKDHESEIDEEEAEWRRQRDAASVARPSINLKRDSTKELHLAATRLQVAFQKYQTRKEQTRITIRVEKQAAAMDIQRSYRGFRERQLALHRRAVMRTILRRREENAAVELMQANVRAYLLNRRRSAKLKLSAVSTLKLTGESELELFTPLPVVQSTLPVAEIVTPAANENEVESIKNDDQPEIKEGEGDTKLNPRQTLVRLLTTFRELASVITMFHRTESRSVKNEEDTESAEDVEPVEEQNSFPSRPASTVPSELFDIEDVELFQQTMQEAQALVGSLHVVLGTVPEENFANDDAELSEDSEEEFSDDDAVQPDLFDDLNQEANSDNDNVNTDQHAEVELKSEGNTIDDENSLNIPFGQRDAMRLQNYAELHLDDSLWSSAMYYPASRKDMAEVEASLALALASREQRKRLVLLKQFISDIYDTIVGKLNELPPRHLADMLSLRCHLALSFTEWRMQRSHIFSRAVAADQPGEVSLAITFSIEHLAREHFRCRLGLPPLIDAALASLHESIEDFAAIDPDVRHFQEFMSHKRSEEELVFCCMCRYLCANRLASDDCPAGFAGSSSHRQPMFHPTTMREVIDVPHALELARRLFRVEEESSIVETDTFFTEVENMVYRQYLPTNGYQQFESIVSSYFVDPDRQAAAVTSINEAYEGQSKTHPRTNTCRRPDGSPRRASAMVRPTNYNQFHAKQYNAQAPSSPIVRHQQQKPTPWWSQPSAADEPKWIYFEEVLALLIKYRGEMNHFHLFSYWVQELFTLAASSSSTDFDKSVLGQDKPVIKLLDDAAFVETLTPLSLGPTGRELKNIFHNSLRQRKLQMLMPLRVFTSVTLLLLKNGLLSVSTYAPMQKLEERNGDDISTEPRQRSLSIREENEDKEWRALALKWRTQESAFEAAIEAIYHDPSPVLLDQTSEPPSSASIDKSRAAHALQLLQLRQELYDLFASRSGRGRDLTRAYEIYEILVHERLARVGGDTRMIDNHLQPSSSIGTWSTGSNCY